MKKFFLVFFVMMLAVGMAFAANTSTVMQTGPSNTATVDQYGNNLADVNQDGSSNIADIDQGASGSAVTNTGTNGAGDWKYGAFIDQLGDRNNASINMKTSSNGASIYQFGNDNIASQVLGASISKTTNFARMGLDIDQVGNNNEAYQTTASSFGTYGVQGMLIDQDGDDNYAEQNSKGGMQSTIEIFQTGDNNSSTQNQWANKGVSHAAIVGNGNTTDQDQTYTVWSTSGQDKAYIDINGDNNTATQFQLGESNIADIDINGNLNIATQTQTGNTNVAGLDQSGDSNSALMVQIGNLNIADLIQSGGSDADLNQVGDSNIIEGLTAGTSASSLLGSSLDVDQLGNLNTLSLFQTNASNAIVLQTGNGNTTIVNQQ